MQHLVPSKNWKLIRATLSVAIAFILLGTPQRSLAIYAAIVVKTNISFNGNGSFVDSYSGIYDPQVPGDHGGVISAEGAVLIGNADIYGFVTTGPEGMVSLGSEGGIGTHAWLSTNSGVEPGYVSNSGSVGFPTVTLPFTNGAGLPSGGTYTVMVGTNILSVSNSPAPPPLPGTNQILFCITNIYYFTNSSYPGPMPGLITLTNVTIASTNIILVTNCSSTALKSVSQPPPEECCPGIAPWQEGKTWYYYPIAGISTNSVYLFSTNETYIWEQIYYSYQIYQAPLYATNYYDHIVCGNYCDATLTGATVVTCPSTLVLTDGLDLSGANSLTILPGGSLSLYVGGGNAIIAGGGITNSPGLDLCLQIYCTPGVSSFSLDTITPLAAEIIAPDTDISINGGAIPVEFYGNIMADSLTVNGVLHLHGDEAVKLPTAPVIFPSVSPPSLLPVQAQTNTIAAVGWQVTFAGLPAYSGMVFQWFFDATNLIANATNFYLPISNVTADMAGEYTLQESSPGLFMVSQPAWLTVVGTPAATLDSFSISASNQFQFNVNGVPGYRYDVERSSNLVDWTFFGSGQCPFTYTDPNQLSAQYFYRAVFEPLP